MSRMEGNNIEAVLANCHRTPFFLFDETRFNTQRRRLDEAYSGIPHRAWYSLKTCPVILPTGVLQRSQMGVEVVSEYEYLAASALGYGARDILINGVGKAEWLLNVEAQQLNVVFDSPREALVLGAKARDRAWRVGLRLRPKCQLDPDDITKVTQFGMSAAEIADVSHYLTNLGLQISILQFHLYSNVATVRTYIAAIQEAMEIASECQLKGIALDCGGGLPSPAERDRITGTTAWSIEFERIGDILRDAIDWQIVREVWTENGRFLVAPTGIFVCRVLDVKTCGTDRYVICDGGRTNHLFPSDWQLLSARSIPRRKAAASWATRYCGPTCMAYDWFHEEENDFDIEPGDIVIVDDVGAYHISWENRFSVPLAAVLWREASGNVRVLRSRETVEQWLVGKGLVTTDAT